MIHISIKHVFVSALISASAAFGAVEFHPAPLVAETTTGAAAFTGQLASTARTYQWLINENQLTDLVGSTLTGVVFRLPPSLSTTWPATDTTYASYEISLGTSVAPSARSLTFADNRVGAQTLVRSGAWTITAGSFASGTGMADWGPTIEIDEWSYTGGHLLVELRHTGSNGISRSVEAFGTTSAGYGSDYSAVWTGSATGTTGSQGNFAVIGFATAIPEPASASLAFGAVALLLTQSRRRRRG